MAEVFGHEVSQQITDIAQLEALSKPVSDTARGKVIDHIDPLAERFIAACPLAVMASRRPDGGVDVTPRGDPAGFIKVLDRKTIALPDRPGNNRLDSFRNILTDPGVGLLLMVPGHLDTLRLIGRAALVRDDALASAMAVNDRPAGLILLIRVDTVMSHCSKAMIRSRAWQPDHWPARGTAPTLAEMVKAHASLPDTVADLEASLEVAYRERLY